MDGHENTFIYFSDDEGNRVAINMANISYVKFKGESDQPPDAIVYFGSRTKESVPLHLKGDDALQLEHQFEMQRMNKQTSTAEAPFDREIV